MRPNRMPTTHLNPRGTYIGISAIEAGRRSRAEVVGETTACSRFSKYSRRSDLRFPTPVLA